MPQGLKNRSHNHHQDQPPPRGRGRPRGAKAPQHQNPRDHSTGESEDSEDSTNNSNSNIEDLLDGTTRRHTDAIPSSSSTTPPTRLQHTPSSSPNTTKFSPHTSGYTQCRARPPVTPESIKTTRKIDVVDEAIFPNKHHQGPTPALLILIVFIILGGIYSLHLAVNEAKEQKRMKETVRSIEEVYKSIKDEILAMSREFTQPREVWVGVMSQLEAVMVKEPSRPAVILVVVPAESRGAATCLVHKLSRAIQKAFEDTQFVMFDTRSSQHSGDGDGDAGLLKMELDSTLHSLSTAHAAVVHNVESIPGDAAMILHAYCDNENAPYKQSVIFLLAEIPRSYSDLSTVRLDVEVDSYLTRVWGERLKEKDASALISRTCNTPVLIKPELPKTVLHMCPL